VDPTGNLITLTVDIITTDGYHLNMIRYLERVVDKLHSNVPLDKSAQSFSANAICKSICESTHGWGLFEFWPSNILSSCKASIIKAVKLDPSISKSTHSTPKSSPMASPSSTIKQIQLTSEIVWESPTLTATTSSSTSQPPVVSNNRLAEGETAVVEFVIRVEVGTAVWWVTHRYREFDALRHFLLLQDPFNVAFKEFCDANFPGKHMLGLAFRTGLLQQRIEGLNAFLTYFLENCRYCRQNSLDALLEFLTVPEQLLQSKLASGASKPGQQVMAKASSQSGLSAAMSSMFGLGSGSGGDKNSGEPAATVHRAQQPSQEEKSSASNNNSNNSSSSSNPVPAPQPLQPKRSSLLSFTTTQKTPVSPPISPAAPPSTVVTVQQLGLLGRNDPRTILYARLQSGILVIKHGRQGAPKRRILQSDSEITALFWMAEPRKRSEASESSLNADKSVQLSEVLSVRMGTEIDPTASRIHPHLSSSHATSYSSAASPVSTSDTLDDGALHPEGTSPGRKLSNGSETQSVATSVALSTQQGTSGKSQYKRKSSFFSSSAGSSDSSGVYTGTATLRRNCKPEDLSLCFSLILPSRTFDIQCLDVADFDLLFYNLKELCSRN